jgi:hypothetical protein
MPVKYKYWEATGQRFARYSSHTARDSRVELYMDRIAGSKGRGCKSTWNPNVKNVFVRELKNLKV